MSLLRIPCVLTRLRSWFLQRKLATANNNTKLLSTWATTELILTVGVDVTQLEGSSEDNKMCGRHKQNKRDNYCVSVFLFLCLCASPGHFGTC